MNYHFCGGVHWAGTLLYDIGSPWLRMAPCHCCPARWLVPFPAICSCLTRLLATASLGPSCFIKPPTEADRHTHVHKHAGVLVYTCLFNTIFTSTNSVTQTYIFIYMHRYIMVNTHTNPVCLRMLLYIRKGQHLPGFLMNALSTNKKVSSY